MSTKRSPSEFSLRLNRSTKIDSRLVVLVQLCWVGISVCTCANNSLSVSGYFYIICDEVLIARLPDMWWLGLALFLVCIIEVCFISITFGLSELLIVSYLQRDGLDNAANSTWFSIFTIRRCHYTPHDRNRPEPFVSFRISIGLRHSRAILRGTIRMSKYNSQRHNQSNLT